MDGDVTPSINYYLQMTSTRELCEGGWKQINILFRVQSKRKSIWERRIDFNWVIDYYVIIYDILNTNWRRKKGKLEDLLEINYKLL